jgi:hypothetical protein
LHARPCEADRRAPPDASLRTRATFFLTGPYWVVVLPSVFMIALLVFYELPVQAGVLADRVERGETVRPAVGFSFPRVVPDILRVMAIPVTLSALGEDELSAELSSTSLRYLGQAGGVLVLYDSESDKVIRLPTGSWGLISLAHAVSSSSPARPTGTRLG